MSSYFLLVLGIIISMIAFIYCIGNIIESKKADKSFKPEYSIKKHRTLDI
jgi:hypothetical protein